jgi:trk system potassium uptake protein TrkH
VTEAASKAPLAPGARVPSIGAPALRLAPPAGVRRWSTAAQLLLFAFAAALGVEWWCPAGAVLSRVMLAIVSALTPLWAFVVLRTERLEEDALAALGPRSRLRTRVFHLSLVLLLLAFLIAKWLVVLRARAHPELIGPSHSYSLAIFGVCALGLFARSLRAARLMALITDHPARLMALSFGTAGLLGAAVLSFPVSLKSVVTVSLVDNLFMAFSAVCVTGLAVNNVAETYSLFGQVVLCALMQIGGLGIMVLSAAFAILAGQRLRVKSSAVIAQMVDASSLASLRRTVSMIVIYTLLLEVMGAVLLHSQFREYPDLALSAGSAQSGPGSLIWASIFHSVSAFCSAGISNTHGGLAPFVGDQGIVLTVASLIVLGSLGFPVLDELFRAAFDKLRRKRLQAFSLHTRVALRMSALLLVVMTLVYGLLEWGASMSPLGGLDHLTAAVFHSASVRSGGFNVVDVGAMRPAVLVLTCAAMFIGASPGSTGGGIKTTTLAVLFAGMRAELSGQTPRLLNRAVPEASLRKAVGVTSLSMAILVAAYTLLLLIEPHPPLSLGFELVSAFTTTGLSTGITPELSLPGKLLILVMMFVGRIGPLTLALAFSQGARASSVELPQERVLIG